MRFRFLPRVPIGTIALAAVAVSGCVDDQTMAPDTSPNFTLSEIAGATGEHVVVLRDRSGPSEDFLRAVEAAGGTVMHRHDDIGVLMVSGLTNDAAGSLSGRGDVEGIDADAMFQWLPPLGEYDLESYEATDVEHHTDPSQTFFFDRFQWNMRQINADRAWTDTRQGDGSLVCVLDTGVDPDHNELAGKVDFSKSASFVVEDLLGETEPNIIDYNFHGTFVSALVTNNTVAMASVAPHATLCTVKVLNVLGSGSFAAIIDGIVHAASVGADAINMSLGAYFSRSEPGAFALIEAVQRAVFFAVEHGTLVVASAGNQGIDLDNDGDFIHVPSQLGAVLSVGATAPINQMNFDLLASYTNYGISGVDLMAPGGDLVDEGVIEDLIFSACSSKQLTLPFECDVNNYVLGSGTSFSSPHVVGAAAVIEAELPVAVGGHVSERCMYGGAAHPDRQFLSRLYGRGRLDVFYGVWWCRGNFASIPPKYSPYGSTY